MERAKILVVDDESRMRKLVKDFLTREGYTVLEAGDGMEAMDLFYEDKEIALIILDVMMPKMDGWQVCREVRETSKVPIIMLTARSEERDELQGFELGVDEYISKPFSPKILVARVNAILRRTFGTVGNDSLEAGGITVDKSAHIVKIDGVATPADAALMMQLGAEGVFVGSGIFKSGNPAKRAAAIVQAVTNYTDAKLIAELSSDLGEAMVGINEQEIELLMAERGK